MKLNIKKLLIILGVIILISLILFGYTRLQRNSLTEDEERAEAEIIALEEGKQIDDNFNIVGNAIQTYEKNLKYLKCSDSDGGKNYDVYGEITLKYSYRNRQNTQTFKDRCNKNQLLEYYCKNNNLALAVYKCLDGCENGACKKPCFKEGERIQFVSGNSCCKGLKEIQLPEIMQEDGSCKLDVSLGMCSNCNNGICESWENKCNCPEDCKNPSECSNKAVIFKEEIKNKYFVSTGECLPNGWCNNEDYVYFDIDSFIADFYENYTDAYDFLIVAPQIMGLQSNFNRMITSSVKGIGLDEFNQSYKVLQSVTAVDLYRSYYSQLSNPDGISLDPVMLNLVIFHEIAHQWCCYIDGVGNFNHELPGHWIKNLDLFSGNKTYGDIMGYNQWMKKDNEMICTDTNDENTEKVFSDLTLYLAGLLPKEKVSPIFLHKFQESNDENYNTWGPSCYDSPNFTETETIAIQDIIDANGERVPSYELSKKDFVFRYVVILPYGSNIDSNFIDYVNLYVSETPQGWSKVTRNTSTARIC
ncbi:MAG: hypothetical protein KKA64_03545 [Nanoarchaeota archaeon]|nr:hypothetical protein [Nanoarchaeota archaeon]